MTAHAPAATGSNSGYQNPASSKLSARNKLARTLWSLVWLLLFRPSLIPMHGWRRCLLRLFGATIGERVLVYPRARIWAPWNLVMKDDSCIGDNVDCYSVAQITLNKGAIVSQYSYLCSASHDYTREDFALIAAPISIGARAWVAAGAFIGPGVQIGERAVVAARAVVIKDVEPWVVCAGNPAKAIKTYCISTDTIGSARD